MKPWHKIAIVLFALITLALCIYLIHLEQEMLALVIMVLGLLGVI